MPALVILLGEEMSNAAMNTTMTLDEALALAVLKGDRVAAYALADKLIEEREMGFDKLKAEAARFRQTVREAYDGYEVYSWPEFKAFCDRAGILYDLRTISISFKIEIGARLEINHVYAGSDNLPNGPDDPK